MYCNILFPSLSFLLFSFLWEWKTNRIARNTHNTYSQYEAGYRLSSQMITGEEDTEVNLKLVRLKAIKKSIKKLREEEDNLVLELCTSVSKMKVTENLNVGDKVRILNDGMSKVKDWKGKVVKIGKMVTVKPFGGRSVVVRSRRNLERYIK